MRGGEAGKGDQGGDGGGLNLLSAILSAFVGGLILNLLGHVPDEGETADVADHRVVERIVEHAARLQADFIVVASKGRSGVAELIVGSTVHALLRRATTPVVVVPHGAPSREHGRLS